MSKKRTNYNSIISTHPSCIINMKSAELTPLHSKGINVYIDGYYMRYTCILFSLPPCVQLIIFLKLDPMSLYDIVLWIICNFPSSYFLSQVPIVVMGFRQKDTSYDKH